MGNTLPNPVLGAITPNVPYVLTDQVTNAKPKQQSDKTMAMFANHDNKIAFYAVIAVAVFYFAKRLRG